MVELVGEDATDLLVAHRPEELRVPVQGDVVELRVEGHRCRGHVEGGRLPDVPAQFRKERRVLEERDEVPVQVEVGVRVAEHRYILSRVAHTLHRTRKKSQKKDTYVGEGPQVTRVVEDVSGRISVGIPGSVGVPLGHHLLRVGCTYPSSHSGSHP